MTTRKTIVAIKLRGGRAARQALGLLAIMLGLAAVGAGIGAAQVIICHRDHPGRPVLECLKGRK